MAKLKIFSFPDDILAKKAAPIERVEKEFRSIADDMLETMYHAPGIGLAANQVGLLKRIIVVDTDYNEEDKPENRKNPIILINPEIIYREGKISTEEACLSVPEYVADVERAEKIKVRYQDIDGLTKELSAEDLLAVCIQHEIDHLEGTLFIDRLNTLKRDFARRKLLKARKERS